jgi:ribosomal protein L40E
MIVCPNCNHPNPDGAVQCEACYTPLPATAKCPNCGATVQSDAAFCGQCGYNLNFHANAVAATTAARTIAPNPVPVALVTPDPIVELLKPDALGIATPNLPPTAIVAPPTPPAVVQEQAVYVPATLTSPPAALEPEIYIPGAPVAQEEEVYIPPAYVQQIDPMTIPEPPKPPAPANVSKTQLQQLVARLFHVQASQEIELPQNLSVIHIGKPNDRIPPDIDVSGFANSEIVSRIHADIRIEGDSCYIEDVGSSNGTYINNLPLLPGNRHRLRPGDRISLGKGDLVTFLFQLS